VAVDVRSEPEARRVVLKFADETEWRVFYSDIVASRSKFTQKYYPHRLKLAPDADFLYLEAVGAYYQGWPTGWLGEKVIYIYDLERREYVGYAITELGGYDSAWRFDLDRRHERIEWIEENRKRTANGRE